MAKVQLNKSQEKCDDFSIWALGMLSAQKKTQEALAFYLNIPQPSLWMRLHGHRDWKLREFYEVQEFFAEDFKQ